MENINLKELKLEDYPSITFDKIRYGDTDRQGHVNNAKFSSFSETGRSEIFHDPENPLAAPDCMFAIANFTVDYLAEVNWPGTVEIGTGFVKVGNSSLFIVQGIYQNNKLCTTVKTVLVHVTERPMKPVPLSEKSREILKKYMLEIK